MPLTGTPGDRLRGEGRTQRDPSPFQLSGGTDRAGSHLCQPLTFSVYSPAHLRGAELTPVPALTHASADESHPPRLPLALSDGLPQQRCKLQQSHVNWTCKTKKPPSSERWQKGAIQRPITVRIEQPCFSTLKGKNQSAGAWGEGDAKGTARNLHFKQGAVKTINGAVSALKLAEEFCYTSGLMDCE